MVWGGRALIVAWSLAQSALLLYLLGHVRTPFQKTAVVLIASFFKTIMPTRICLDLLSAIAWKLEQQSESQESHWSNKPIVLDFISAVVDGVFYAIAIFQIAWLIIGKA